MGFVRVILGFLAAVLIGAVLVTLAQTQVNLQSLADIGAEIGLGARLDASARDLVGLGPTMAIVLGLGFLIAFIVTAIILIFVPHLRLIGYPLAGAAAVAAAILGVEAFYGWMLDSTITPFAAARTLAGLLAMALGGAVAGLAFAQILGPSRREA